jgi:hypothetical protein
VRIEGLLVTDCGTFCLEGDGCVFANTIEPCCRDTDGNGSVDVDDLAAVVLDWGGDGAAHGGDVDGSGVVDADDLVAVILAWGPCPEPLGACCVEELLPVYCAHATEADCAEVAGGVWTEGQGCDEVCVLPCGGCPPDESCFIGCGTLVQGAECVLFQWDLAPSLRFRLSELGDFGVGDSVAVEGCLDPDCITTCQEGSGCIDNSIGPCESP